MGAHVVVCWHAFGCLPMHVLYAFCTLSPVDLAIAMQQGITGTGSAHGRVGAHGMVYWYDRLSAMRAHVAEYHPGLGWSAHARAVHCSYTLPHVAIMRAQGTMQVHMENQHRKARTVH